MVVNVHERVLRTDAVELGRILDTVGGPGDELWVTDVVAPMILDRGLEVGSSGGHGPVRYEVVEYEPGVRVRFRFRPGVGLDGWHEFAVVTDPGPTVVLRHTIRARLTAMGVIMWPMVRMIHDAALEDILDNLERRFGAEPAGPTAGRLGRAIGRMSRMGRQRRVPARAPFTTARRLPPGCATA